MKYLKLLLIVLLCHTSFVYGQTTLSIGDIAITGYNSSDSNEDEFSFVLLEDITIGTIINFTDIGWRTLGSFRPGTAEGVLQWTANTDLTCGTEIIIVATVSGVTVTGYSATIGNVIEINGGFGFNPNQDQIIVYQGAFNSPSILYAIHYGSVSWTNATSPTTSAVPAGLTDGVSAIYMGDNRAGNYDCSVSAGITPILNQVADTSNWMLLANGHIATLGGCTYSCCPSTVWDGMNWSLGTPDINTAVIINGNYNTNVATPGFSACNLTVNSTYTLTVDENYTVEVENNVINNGNISVLTDGSFVQNNDLATFSNLGAGISSVTKLSAIANDALEYTYWSSPVLGETIGNGLFEAPENRRFRFRAENFRDSGAETDNDNVLIMGSNDDEDDNGDDWLLMNGTDIMELGVGYAATLSSITFNAPGGGTGTQFAHTFDGPLNNGIIDVTVYRNEGDAADSDNAWNFIGNPYPSAISIDSFFNENVFTENVNGVLEGAIYFWSHQNAPASNINGNSGLNFGQTDYVLVNDLGGTTAGDITGDGVIDADDLPKPFIPSGQGFFISFDDSATNIITAANSDEGDTVVEASVTFNNSMRVSGDNNQFYKTSQNTVNRIWLNLATDTGVFNQILIGYKTGATNTTDGSKYDAIRNRSFGNNTFFYSIIDGDTNNYAIQGKAPESLTLDEIIPLGLYTTITNPTIYTISIAHIEGAFLTSNTIYLKDNYSNLVHDLTNSNYSFTTVDGEFRDRFEIIFKTNTLSTNSFETNVNNLSITELQNDNVKFSYNGDLTIKSIKILDVLGRNIYQFRGSENTGIYNLRNVNSSIYIAQIELSNGSVITRKAIKK